MIKYLNYLFYYVFFAKYLLNIIKKNYIFNLY